MDSEQQKKLMNQILELRDKVRMYGTEHVHDQPTSTQMVFSRLH